MAAAVVETLSTARPSRSNRLMKSFAVCSILCMLSLTPPVMVSELYDGEPSGLEFTLLLTNDLDEIQALLNVLDLLVLDKGCNQ